MGVKGVEVRETVVVDVVKITETALAKAADAAVTKTLSLMELAQVPRTRSNEA